MGTGPNEGEGAGGGLIGPTEHKGKIDLSLSDVVMPEMSGVELAKALKAKTA